MNPLNLVTDSYERRARLYPAILLLSPAVAIYAAIASAKWSGIQTAIAAGVTLGGAYLLGQFARDAGKRREPKLINSWGGLPSATIFRHRDQRLDAISKGRYHKKLSSLVKEAKAPTPEQEETNLAAADAVYTAWSNYLRVNTREKKFNLLFEENVSYGYRRNVYGLRPIGVIISGVSFVGSALWLFARYRDDGRLNEPLIGAAVFSVVVLCLWLFLFTTEWVRVPAEAYARRLAESVEAFPLAKAVPASSRSRK